MRDAIARLVSEGRLPGEESPPGSGGDAHLARVEVLEPLILAVDAGSPVSDEEARALAHLFPASGSCYGMAWVLLHAIETAPGWPLADVLDLEGEWIERLRLRVQESAGRAGGQ